MQDTPIVRGPLADQGLARKLMEAARRNALTWADRVAIGQAIGRLHGESELHQALRIFVHAAYAVSTDINPRGWAWSEAYLDGALSEARSILARYVPDSSKTADGSQVLVHAYWANGHREEIEFWHWPAREELPATAVRFDIAWPDLTEAPMRADHQTDTATCGWVSPAGRVYASRLQAVQNGEQMIEALVRRSDAEAAIAGARTLAKVRDAITGYHLALDERQHGGVAANAALDAIQDALGMQWVQGAALAAKEAHPHA